jgi:hypothetical protein
MWKSTTMSVEDLVFEFLYMARVDTRVMGRLLTLIVFCWRCKL